MPESETPPAPKEDSSKAEGRAKLAATRLWTLVKKWIVLPIVGVLIGAIVIGRVSELVLGVKTYRVYFAGSLEEETVRQIGNALFAKGARLHDLNGVQVELQKVDDMGDPVNAQRIAATLAEKRDTLMVVGHVFSTQTREALPAYLQKADPPIPAVLTTETNPNILPPKTVKGDYYPVFRLSPTDDAQAQTAARFALSRGAKGFWVVEDVTNPVYANFLAREFIRTIQQQSQKVLLWSTSNGIPPVEAIKTLGIDWVFFAGDVQSALILVHQLKAVSGPHKFTVILSDGCTDQQLIDQGSNDVEGVFLTHPMTAARFREAHYGQYGADARALIDQLLEEANNRFGELASRRAKVAYSLRRLLGIRRVADARNAVIALMEEAVRTEHSFDLSAQDRCQFRDDGRRKGVPFHVWQVKNGQFTDIE